MIAAPAKLTIAQKRVIQREAHATFERIQRMITDYREAEAEDNRNGHRTHYCVHGVNMWVDYDCACYRCEDGETIYTLEATTLADCIRETLDEYRHSMPKITAKIEETVHHFAALLRLTSNTELKMSLVDTRTAMMIEALGRWA